MRHVNFPEDRNEVELERTIICNKIIRELCLHEIRLATAMAREDDFRRAASDYYHDATCSTHKLRQVVHECFRNECDALVPDGLRREH